MAILRIGPDGMLNVYALVVSVIVALLSWRRVSLARSGTATIGAATALAILQYFTLDSAGLFRGLVGASFIIVPSAMLLAASRLNWLARRAGCSSSWDRSHSSAATSAFARSATVPSCSDTRRAQ